MRNATFWRITKPLRLLRQYLRCVQASFNFVNSKRIFLLLCWMAQKARLLREKGVLVQLLFLVRKLSIGIGRPIIQYFNKYPKSRQRLLKFANIIGISKILSKLIARTKMFVESADFSLHKQVVSSYPIWTSHFDTPSIETVHNLEISAHLDSYVFIIARFDEKSEQYAEDLALRLIKSIGQQWQAVFIFGPNCNNSKIIQEIQRVTNNDTRISFNLPQFDSKVEFFILIQGGALPRAHALRVFVDALRKQTNALVAYSDEDKYNKAAPSSNPWFKPQFSPLLISQGILLGKMLAFRSVGGTAQALIEQLAAEAVEPAEFVRNYTLEAGESRVISIPHVLYHDAFVENQLRIVNWALPVNLPLVSVVIPTRDRWDLLGPCLDSLRKTDWPTERLEIVVIDNGSTEPLFMKMLEKTKETNFIKVVRDDNQFNWSRLNNIAVRESSGELLVFLNNDTELLDESWLKKLATHALRPGTGAVGCKLLYPDQTVQHGGVIAGIQGVVGHAHLFLQKNEGGYQNLANITHEVTAVTGACLCVSRINFEAIGGFNEGFRMAFNDVAFCFALHMYGKRNVYVGDPLFIHHESKSRGYDDTPEKLSLQNTEARKIWALYPQLMRNDPFYSPNLSLWKPYELSFAPRRRAIWDSQIKRRTRVMLLSVTHAIGHGVAVVVAKQAESLLKNGYEVIIAGPRSANDFLYPGCERVEINDPRSATTLAVIRLVDLIIAETPPFYSVARWTGSFPPVLAYDYGEPPPDWFPDAVGRRAILMEKDQSLMMATAVFAISDAIVAESRTPVNGVIPLGNSHLGQWNDVDIKRRQKVRNERGWDDKFVVLNVCRFHEGERLYKGVDIYADTRLALATINQELSKRALFVLCGKGSPADVEVMTKRGLCVAANVADDEMLDLYCAADAYANFSQWEGYNLGIGQALAMGLPTIASDIPAHRAFGINVTNNTIVAAELLIQISAQNVNRTPHVWNWDDQLQKLITEVDSLCGGSNLGFKF